MSLSGAPRDVGARIQSARRRAGLTQAEFARRIKVAKIHVSQWERGIAHPSPAHLDAIELRTGIAAEWLSTGALAMDKAAPWYAKPVYHADDEPFLVGSGKRTAGTVPDAARGKRVWRSFVERPTLPRCGQCGGRDGVLFGICTPCFVGLRNAG